MLLTTIMLATGFPISSLLSTTFADDRTDTIDQRDVGALLAENRSILGIVQAVASDQIKVDTGEIQPRFLPIKQAQEKGAAPLKAGDHVVIVLNEQNLIVDFHSAETGSSQHEIIKGHIAQTLPVGHDMAVIKSAGKELSLPIRSQVRSKLAAIPVGVPAIFLIDEAGQIADATFTDLRAAKEAHHQPDRTSPSKGTHSQVDGTIVEPLHASRITIRTPSGSKTSYEVRDILHQKLGGLQKGQKVVLLIDNENKVIDMAIPPSSRP